MKDFTLIAYKALLDALISAGYEFQSFAAYLKGAKEKVVILRHDVDRWPKNALLMAELESMLSIKSTYYFRIIRKVYNVSTIMKIQSMGHEIGYHYEDLAMCNGDFDLAFLSYKRNIERMNKLCEIQTICAHGSPLSKWDSKKLWNSFSYKHLTVMGDIGIDCDYEKVFYITDNGRAWNKSSASVRDKVVSKYDIPINDTYHLIELIKQGRLPDKVMINAHPDTFFEFGLKWLGNYVLIETKNIVKKIIVKYGIIK